MIINIYKDTDETQKPNNKPQIQRTKQKESYFTKFIDGIPHY